MNLKVIAIVVAVILVVAGLALAVKTQKQPEEAKVSNVKFIITKDDVSTPEEGDEKQIASLSMDVPSETNLMQSFLDRPLNTVSETVNVNTDIDENTVVHIYTVVSVWWNTQDIQTIDEVQLETTAHDGNGNAFRDTASSNEILTNTRNSDIPVDTSESNPFKISPTNPDLTYDEVYYETLHGSSDIVIQTTDGSQFTNEVTVTAQGKDGKTFTKTITINTTLNVSYNSYDSSISLEGSVDDVGTSDQMVK